MATERDRMRKDIAMRASDAGPLNRRLNALAVYQRPFEQPGFQFGEWVEQAGRGRWYRLSRVGRDFLEYCNDNGWVQGFAWVEWKATPEAQRFLTDHTAVGDATPLDLSRLITVLVRQDRLDEGCLGAAYDTGLLTAIVRRASSLLAAPPPEGDTTDWPTWWGMDHAERRAVDAAFSTPDTA